MDGVRGEQMLMRRVLCGSAVTATATVYTPPVWALVLAGLTVWPVAIVEWSNARRRLHDPSGSSMRGPSGSSMRGPSGSSMRGPSGPGAIAT